MPEREGLSRLQALDAFAAEQGRVLAFRVCEESGDLEPVLIDLSRAEAGEGNEATLITIGDLNGLPLGRYVVPRSRLDQALEAAGEVAEPAPEPTAVPLDWQQA